MKSDPRDYRLEISSIDSQKTQSSAGQGRPYLSVLFACCKVYQRIYRTPDAKEYKGRCPRCGKQVTFAVGPDGTASRAFVVH